MLAATALICFWSFSKLPNSCLIAAASSPCGRPPAFGAMFFQNREWSTWPDRLNARAFSSAPMSSNWSLSRASARRSSAAFAPFT